jgi:hypothetical protein
MCIKLKEFVQLISHAECEKIIIKRKKREEKKRKNKDILKTYKILC